jgi:ParB-like chromosome segregation protein Spo0J
MPAAKKKAAKKKIAKKKATTKAAKPALTVERIAVSNLAADPANARAHPERNIDSIKASLTRFGQQKPIVVNDKGVVVAGSGTLRAAAELGWSHLDAVKTSLSRLDAVAYAIADNRTTDTSYFDNDVLSSILVALREEDASIVAAAGYTDAELEALIGSAPVAPSEFPEVDETIDIEHVCPKCGFQFSGGKTVSVQDGENEPQEQGQ